MTKEDYDKRRANPSSYAVGSIVVYGFAHVLPQTDDTDFPYHNESLLSYEPGRVHI